jgi:glucose-6-phosphate isomerase
MSNSRDQASKNMKATILGDRFPPETLGKLVALYEHAVLTQRTIWQINTFG